MLPPLPLPLHVNVSLSTVGVSCFMLLISLSEFTQILGKKIPWLLINFHDNSRIHFQGYCTYNGNTLRVLQNKMVDIFISNIHLIEKKEFQLNFKSCNFNSILGKSEIPWLSWPQMQIPWLFITVWTLLVFYLILLSNPGTTFKLQNSFP